MKNCILGFAIGDAFGSGIEFQDRNWIRKNVNFTCFINEREQLSKKLNSEVFSKNYVEWGYSDDTEMLIALIKAVLSKNDFTEEVLVDFFLKEYQLGIERNSHPRNGHGSMQWFFDGKMSIEEIKQFQKNREYPGNAPGMRALALGLLPSETIDDFALINANATHPHPKAQALSLVVARASEYMLVKKENPERLIDYCRNFIKNIDTETFNLLKQIDTLPSPDKLKEEDFLLICGPQPIQAPRFLEGIHGLPSDAMQTTAAICYVLKYAEHTFHALKLSIEMGGDVDTLAAVCCGITAGIHGLDSLPSFMLENLKEKEYLTQIANDFQRYLDHV